MSPRFASSLFGVFLGFSCVFPLLLRREKKTPVRDADFLLQQAQQQMREAQAKNRVRAVDAITQKNNLQALVDQTQKRVDRLTEEAEAPEAFPDTEARRNLLAERDKYLETLVQTQASLAAAITTTEAIKTAMRREEERIRAMTAEALSLKAQEKQAQIEMAIAKSKLAMTTNLATDLFVQAREKIQQTKAQRDLLVQIVRTIETLDTTAQEADTVGNETQRQKLIASRDALRVSALDASLWKT